MATTTDEAPVEINAGLLKELEALEEHLGKAHAALEELLPIGDGLGGRIGANMPLFWLLQGFTSDAILDAEWMLREALLLRSKVMGGLTPHECKMLEAVGGEH